MIKKVAIIVRQFEDIEYSSPKEALEKCSFNCSDWSIANSEVVGKHSEKVTVDVGIAEAQNPKL